MLLRKTAALLRKIVRFEPEKCRGGPARNAPPLPRVMATVAAVSGAAGPFRLRQIDFRSGTMRKATRSPGMLVRIMPGCRPVRAGLVPRVASTTAAPPAR